MEVLVCLAEHSGEAVPKEKLLQTVWPDTFVSDDVLKRSVSRDHCWNTEQPGQLYQFEDTDCGPLVRL